MPGTPGIGKSLFGILLIAELVRLTKTEDVRLKDMKAIVYESRPTTLDPPRYFRINAKDGEVTDMDGNEMYAAVNDESHTILIKDGPCSSNDMSRCRKVWICSPRPKGFRKWTENNGIREQFLAPFETFELVECVKYGEMQDLFSWLLRVYI